MARLSRPVSVRRLRTEEAIHIEATPEERAQIAEALELVSLDSLTADITLRPWRTEGVRVEGAVHAALVQACIVTLEPVPGTVDEEIDVRLHPDASDSGPVDVDPDAPDPPEPLDGDFVDVGAIVLEHFALGIEPYPRAPGAEFDPGDAVDPVEEEPSPFAALAALKNSPD